MINGLGVVGWGVGGIEAEACMLGQPIYMVMPQVVGFRLHGKLPEGSTATDLGSLPAGTVAGLSGVSAPSAPTAYCETVSSPEFAT